MTVVAKTYASLQVQDWDGQRIKRPGVYDGIDMESYHGDICVEKSVSSSGLRKLYSPVPWVKASPAHYWKQSIYNDERQEDEDETEAMTLGRAAHHLLFGEKAFGDLFEMRPATINGQTFTGNSTVYKLWKKKQDDLGKTVITSKQLQAIKGIARELAKEPLVVDPEGKREGILNGKIEHSWFFKHRSGVWVKVRPDATPSDSLDFVDLKVTHSIMWPDMQKTIRDQGYYMQAGLTAMAVQAITGQPLNSFTFVFAESAEPHCIEIVTLRDTEIARGIAACEIAIAMFVKCLSTNRWPGPRGDREDAQYIEMSETDQKRVDERLALDKAASMGESP